VQNVRNGLQWWGSTEDILEERRIKTRRKDPAPYRTREHRLHGTPEEKGRKLRVFYGMT
jgi:hypothetical protein